MWVIFTFSYVQLCKTLSSWPKIRTLQRSDWNLLAPAVWYRSCGARSIGRKLMRTCTHLWFVLGSAVARIGHPLTPLRREEGIVVRVWESSCRGKMENRLKEVFDRLWIVLLQSVLTFFNSKFYPTLAYIFPRPSYINICHFGIYRFINFIMHYM